jgi:hypothetical protein
MFPHNAPPKPREPANGLRFRSMSRKRISASRNKHAYAQREARRWPAGSASTPVLSVSDERQIADTIVAKAEDLAIAALSVRRCR